MAATVKVSGAGKALPACWLWLTPPVLAIVKPWDFSQFWTFDEKWFLEQPVYSRDYPALKS